jgi:hypothetical protein
MLITFLNKISMNTYGFQQFFTIEKLKKSAEPAVCWCRFYPIAETDAESKLLTNFTIDLGNFQL